jgi:hypothetical protein
MFSKGFPGEVDLGQVHDAGSRRQISGPSRLDETACFKRHILQVPSLTFLFPDDHVS